MLVLDSLKIELNETREVLNEIKNSLDTDGKNKRIEEINHLMEKPEFWNDVENANAISKELKDITDSINTYNSLYKSLNDIDELISLASNENDESLAKEIVNQFDELSVKIDDVRTSLLLSGEYDKLDAILRLNAGSGGTESCDFCHMRYRMYSKYADSQRWKIELVSVNESGIGGFKEVIFMVNGKGAYSRLKYESGVQRVQRIPVTESGGRIHTSTATVAIMPEAEEVEVNLDLNDCKFDVFRASGNGGQCVNTTDSAVRLTHIPTGIVISCQDEKSQLKNRDKALRVLRAKLYELELEKAHDAEAELKKSQVGTGDRSEKIRTYNFPQSRCTDHRIKLTLYTLEDVMNGNLDQLIDSLTAADQAAKLLKMSES